MCVCVWLWLWPSVLWRCWLGVRKGIRPVKTGWWGAGVVIWLERGVILHMAQRMPLPLTVSCFSKIQIGFTFLVPAHPGSPRQRAVKRVCDCGFTDCYEQYCHYYHILQQLTLRKLNLQYGKQYKWLSYNADWLWKRRNIISCISTVGGSLFSVVSLKNAVMWQWQRSYRCQQWPSQSSKFVRNNYSWVFVGR